jgi:hypothetical protein
MKKYKIKLKDGDGITILDNEKVMLISKDMPMKRLFEYITTFKIGSDIEVVGTEVKND